MDLLSQHEAFLRAIFDNPEDDTARLVYADFLEEHGNEAHAELIRVQCELSARNDFLDAVQVAALRGRETELVRLVVPSSEPAFMHGCRVSRGFWHEEVYGGIQLSVESFVDLIAFRWSVVKLFPSWFGETKLYVRAGSSLRPEHFRNLFGLPFIQHVMEWNLAGQVDTVRPEEWTEAQRAEEGDFEFLPRTLGTYGRPVVTTAGVNVLTRHRGATRILSLDLRYNNLGNDAARALAQSPYLDNLKQLLFLQGNDVSGKVWQKVIERFGEKVAG